MHAQEAIRLLRRQADRLRTLDVVEFRQPAFGRWFRETKAALDAIFGPATGPNREFQEIIFQPLRPSKRDPDSDWRLAYEKGVPVALAFFDSVVTDLTAHPDRVGGASPPENVRENPAGGASSPEKSRGKIAAERDACLVVGSEGAHDDVVRFLEKIGSRVIALNAQSDGATSLLDGLDEHADVAFAVMLLTADESGGGAKNRTAKLARRPGRNVTLELGVLLGRLGRKNVCVLYREGVKIPTDSDGIVCVPLDARGAWRFDLARAMKGAGLPVDLNNAV
jgi:Predicted nucleotide-binding protein containing TIR-like domain